MLLVALLTLGSPEQLTGGYLYHRRMADLAPDHEARVDFVSVSPLRNPLTSVRRADVIVVDSIAAARVAPWAKARPPAPPLAASLHQPPGGIDHRRSRREIQAAVDRWLYRRCQLLLAASDALAEELVHTHGMRAELVRVVAPGRDVAPLPDHGPDMRDGRRAAFLSVGNWVKRKGTLELLEAFARLPPDAATLHLVGRDDVEPRYAARVHDRLLARDLRGRVVAHGPRTREQVAAFYRSADLFVLSSYAEPYGTVYGEALAAGLPVVGWRAGNIKHLAQDGREGVLVDPGDVAALAAALEKLATDRAWRNRLAAGASRRGAQLPTWAESARAFFGALKALAADSTR